VVVGPGAIALEPETLLGATMNEESRSKTGIPGLDEVLFGGLIAQQVYLIDGAPGAGKTTFALQYLMEGV
jgi:circadian clock protein KaiC